MHARNERSSPSIRLLPLCALVALLALATASCASVPVSMMTPLDVQLPLGKYTLAMSSFPGYPLEIHSVEGARVRVTADAGGLLRWGPETASVVEREGREITFEASAIVYWSPLEGEDASLDALPAEAWIEVTASKDGLSPRTVHVVVRSTKDGFYSGSIEK